MKSLQGKKAQPGTRAVRTADEKRREAGKALAKIRKVQDEVRRLGLAETMLTDKDLYDENGLPK
jgi:hypothetical protein